MANEQPTASFIPEKATQPDRTALKAECGEPVGTVGRLAHDVEVLGIGVPVGVRYSLETPKVNRHIPGFAGTNAGLGAVVGGIMGGTAGGPLGAVAGAAAGAVIGAASAPALVATVGGVLGGVAGVVVAEEDTSTHNKQVAACLKKSGPGV